MEESKALAKAEPSEIDLRKAAEATSIELALVDGDLSRLKPAERVAFYQRTCESLGLNPITKPFEYLRLNGKLTLYATKNCTDQLRYIHKVSIMVVSREKVGDVSVVTARATMPSGRQDESTGAVFLGRKQGDELANALMKAETKAKRRVTLSICGLSFTDESEVDSIRGAEKISKEVAESVEMLPAPAAPQPEATPPAPSPEESAADAMDSRQARPVTEKQIHRMFAIANSKGINRQTVGKWIDQKFQKREPKELMRDEYDQICNYMLSLPTTSQQEGHA